MKNILIYIIQLILLLVLFVATMCVGAVDISVKDVFASLFGVKTDEMWRYIVVESRLPMACAALLAGAALSASGLIFQTVFSNPLAGPSILGVSSGASLGVAIMMLVGGSWLSGLIDRIQWLGISATLPGAIFGAGLIVVVLLLFSRFIKSGMTLLIIGIMFSYLSSSIITFLNYFAPAEDVKSYAVWGMGSFMGMTTSTLPFFAILVVILLISTIFLAKPLNALLLGERYAANLGYSMKRVRGWLLTVASLLAAVVTAFCGPIGFIGLIVPHLARMTMQTSNHFVLLPATVLTGASITLLCALITVIPTNLGILPVNAVTPIFGVPVILYILVAGKKLTYFN